MSWTCWPAWRSEFPFRLTSGTRMCVPRASCAPTGAASVHPGRTHSCLHPRRLSQGGPVLRILVRRDMYPLATCYYPAATTERLPVRRACVWRSTEPSAHRSPCGGYNDPPNASSTRLVKYPAPTVVLATCVPVRLRVHWRVRVGSRGGLIGAT